ncbi:MAG: APC family permease [Verrucomicrobia bacterium]|nr:APC family permease [Verrucomicrobiota bacterium]
MAILDLVLGRPLSSAEDKDERVGSFAGVSVFGLDALSSAAYGPEAALTVLLPLGVAGLGFSLPITIAVSSILAVVYFSYRQTISAYPNGAGTYTVAKENLGAHVGLLGAVALLIDYTLNVAVGISAGIGALVSAIPFLQSYTVVLCLSVLALLAFMNLRGIRESGLAFLPPTYLFVGCFGIVLIIGIYKTLVSGGHPHAVASLPAPPAGKEQISWWLFLKAFAAGCTAMTGVEAVSNGVQAFKEPVVSSARRTLAFIVVILILILLGVAYLVAVYGITATQPGTPSYQSILSLLAAAVVGRGPFYFVTLGAVLLVLCLSANTSFADFPRVCRAVAEDGFLPYSFATRGRRLAYTEGIWFLTLMAAGLLILFNGVTDKLIPLFAVGAFLAFTLSQAGMVVHWLKKKSRSAGFSSAVNAVGALATAITFLIVVVTKFAEGAWVVVIVVPTLYLLMYSIKRHYSKIAREVAISERPRLEPSRDMIAVVPVQSPNALAQKALRTAYGLSRRIQVVHILQENDKSDFVLEWNRHVQASIDGAGLPNPELVILESPYRKVISPILDHIWKLERENPDQTVVILIPQLVEAHWYYTFLHNQREKILQYELLLKGENRILIVNIPWKIEKDHSRRDTRNDAKKSTKSES